MTEQGYQDFDIKPALEFSVVDSTTKEERQVEFDWEIVEFKENIAKIKINFEDPESLTDTNDQLEITFWGNKLFKGKKGETIPAGYTIRTPITRQVQKERGDVFKMAG